MCFDTYAGEKEDVEKGSITFLSIPDRRISVPASGRKDAVMKNRRLKGSMTIEMSVLLPVILLMSMGLILSVFYFHDKNILNGAASETAAVGSTHLRGEEKITEEELVDFCRERIKGKCIFLVSHKISAAIGKEEVVIKIASAKKGFTVSVVKKAVITEPEKKIRDIRRLDIKDGT